MSSGKKQSSPEELRDAVAMVDTLQAYLAKRLPSCDYTKLHRDIIHLRAKLRNLTALYEDQ